MKNFLTIAVIIALVGCKMTGSVSNTKSNEISKNSEFLLYLSGKKIEAGTSFNSSPASGGFSVNHKTESAKTALEGNSQSKKGPVQYLCLNITSNKMGSEDALQSDKILGMKINDYKSLVERFSPKVNQLIATLLEQDVISLKDLENKEIEKFIANFSDDMASKKNCQPQDTKATNLSDGGQLGLVQTVGTAKYVQIFNQHGSLLILQIQGTVLTANGLLKSSPWGQYNINAGGSLRPTYAGSQAWTTIQWRGYVNGQLLYSGAKDITTGPGNTFGLNFTPNAITVPPVGNPGNGGTANADVKACQNMLIQTRNYYLNSSLWSSAPSNERAGCIQAASKPGLNWNPLMKKFYCEIPGVPARKCFTTLAGQYKASGIDERSAYNSAYATCSARPDQPFKYFTAAQHDAFKKIMLNRVRSSNDSLCISVLN